MRKNISIPDNLNARLHEFSKTHGSTDSAIICIALERYLNIEQNKSRRTTMECKTSISELIKIYKSCVRERLNEDTTIQQIAGEIHRYTKDVSLSKKIAQEAYKLFKRYVGRRNRLKIIHSTLIFDYSKYLYSSLKT